MMRGIVARCDPPAIPVRSRDWFAVERGFDAECDPIGYGATADEAVADLQSQIEERDNARN